MSSEEKKISFGFSKLAKKPVLTPTIIEKPKEELVVCFENSKIKIKDAVEEVEEKPMVIEMKGNKNDLTSRIERESLKKTKKIIEDKIEDTRPDSELTLDELAARQLIAEAKNRLTQEKDTTVVHKLPLVNDVFNDGVEATLDDYQKVPITDYGMAMLRGMGWKEGMCIGLKQANVSLPPEPELRPKGLGLGAQRMVKVKNEKVVDKNGKKLVLSPGGYGKIVAGNSKGAYCEIQGFDEESGRVIVKVNRTNEILTLNELFVTPVTKENFNLGSKVINNVKYEEYKEKEMKHENKEQPSTSTDIKVKREPNKSRHKIKKRDSSTDSEELRRRKDKYSKKSKRESSSEESEYSHRKNKRRSNSTESEYRKKSKRDKYKRSSSTDSEYCRDSSRTKRRSVSTDSEYSKKSKREKHRRSNSRETEYHERSKSKKDKRKNKKRDRRSTSRGRYNSK